MSNLSDKVKRSIDILKAFEPVNESYYLCYSGGKDSDCIRILAELSGVKYELHHSLTSVDAPETIQYIKTIPNLIIDKPTFKDGTRKTMWNLIPLKLMPPTRLARYCCTELKEYGGRGRFKVTGVRWSESLSRKTNADVLVLNGKPKHTIKALDDRGISYSINEKGGIILDYDNEVLRDDNDFLQQCYRTRQTTLNPIVDWSDNDVWDFLSFYGCKSNPLYSCKFSRIGCIGCPLGGSRSMKAELSLYPVYKNNYIKSFDRMIVQRKALNKPSKLNWSCGEDVLNWWIQADTSQILFDGFSYFDV